MTSTTPSGPDAADARPSRPTGATGPALDVATSLAGHLSEVALPLEVPGVAHARDLRDRVLAQITTHLIPRLREAATPAILVVGGPTGAGKSTLVNTLAGRTVSPAGVLRPTTRRPVLVVNPAEAHLVADHPVRRLADVVAADGVPAGLALLDAPDLDSVDEGNRRLSVELVEAADMWLFVTTAHRYGDALPWEILDVVRRRGVTIAVVLDRVATDVLDEVRRDLLSRLVESGFGSVPLLVVPDAGPVDGPLPAENVREVAQWIGLLATRAGAQGITARTVRGVWSPLRAEVRELLDAVVAQTDAATELTSLATGAAAVAADDLVSQLAEGALADGGPTTRWLVLAGSRGPLEPLAHEVRGFLARRRVPRQAPERASALEVLRAEVDRSFSDVLGRAAATAETAVRDAWTSAPTASQAGSALAADRGSAVAASERAERVRAAWDGWLADVAALVPVAADGGSEAPPLLEATGRGTLLLLAAAGIDGATTAARRVWPAAEADRAIAAARDALAVHARNLVAAEATGFTTPLAQRFDPEAAAALRLRVAELRMLAGEA
ncbi:GTPase family protein [Serinibacter arcticus]|uniref:Putative ABC transporter n=1 Tax=Serinibacter arcticus TaxID=1655435 RepID=A0A4Z1E9C3_9MICO|nr:GTPase domain-containing protein [Serinibacter arcticus]TGO06031.1 putative ABC transporter [Serinibacter arcticus]